MGSPGGANSPLTSVLSATRSRSPTSPGNRSPLLVNLKIHEREPGIASQRGWRLHEAAGGGDVEAVKRLLRQGCFLDEVDEDGWTALRHSVHYGQLAVATLLVKAGANVDHRATPGGKTALHTAAYNNRPDICLMLLMHGANPNAEDEHGFVPFDIVYCPKDSRDYTREVLQEYGGVKKKNPEARVVNRK